MAASWCGLFPHVFGWPTQCRPNYEINGRTTGKFGYVFIPNRGIPRLDENITSVFGAIEHWLDAGHSACLLRRRECAEIVAETLRHFEGERLVLISFVIMPNHVHTLFVQNPLWPLEKLLQSWKRFTTREINRLLDRAGNLWQRDYFDRLGRDEKHFANCVRYIGRNPEKAKLPPSEFILRESEIARATM